MRTFTLIAILTCALLVIYHAAEAEELEAKDVIESKALATLDEERFECSLSCDIKKNGKPCKGIRREEMFRRMEMQDEISVLKF
uniref:U5-Theraphotoxin-Ct1a_1 n=1 Tax=Coremiocnemis tropix TaxID=1904443 RepID=A0A482Z9P8_CORTR